MKEKALGESRKSVRQVYTDTVVSAAENLRNDHPDEQVGVSISTYDQIATILQNVRNEVRPELLKSRKIRRP